jgi:hypothetical protein
MRAAQYRLPRAQGDTEDGELVLFFFGKGRGGGVDDNVARWCGQFTQPDGRSSREVATITTRTVNGLRVTSVDVGGTYAGMRPGGAAAEAKAGFRMLAAVVEGTEGPWFWRAVGPAATIARAKGDFDALLASVEAHP